MLVVEKRERERERETETISRVFGVTWQLIRGP
jgi:hypothetical protein